MEVFVESLDGNDCTTRKAAERRLRFALRRLSWLVPHAVVRLSRLRRDGTQADKRCEVRLKLVGAEDVVMTATSRCWLESIDDALKGAARRLERQYRRVYAV